MNETQEIDNGEVIESDPSEAAKDQQRINELHAIGLSNDCIVRITDRILFTSPTKTLTPEARERIACIMDIHEKLEKTGMDVQIETFLLSAQSFLDGRMPMEMVEQKKGDDVVLALHTTFIGSTFLEQGNNVVFIVGTLPRKQMEAAGILTTSAL